jgi:LIVCS family branched-chain amino acid:cation transporter
MNQKLSFSSYLMIGSMLFGLFFGAGNLIFPVHLGQESGSAVFLATLGFLVTATGLPFLGVIAMGFSQSSGLFELSSRVHPAFGYMMTVLLYLTIGPFFALPRTGTVSFEIGFAPYIAPEYKSIGLACFTIAFFGTALFFSMRPSKILVWVGKILNPLFLIFLAVLIMISFVNPMGVAAEAPIQEAYTTAPFFKGFTEGYNTMDALASLAFAIIVIRTIKDLGLKEPKDIALGTVKAGIVVVVLMAVIYSCLAYIGASSIGKFELSANGGIALRQVAQYYFGTKGSVLLAIIVTLACLKTAIGLITACAETFHGLFPNVMDYKKYVLAFATFACVVANIGLTQLIALSIPMLMFLYPLAIVLILVAFISPFFHDDRRIYFIPMVFTMFASVADALNAMPDVIKVHPAVQGILGIYQEYLPFFQIGMGWIVPAVLGLCVSMIAYFIAKPKQNVA